MTTCISRAIATATLVLSLNAPVALALPASSVDVDVPPVPSGIAVPDGHVVFLEGHAVGTQNYICMPAAAGHSWRFVGPQATLFLTFNDERHRQVTTHFLSANPFEYGLARPTWQDSSDSSRIWGRVAASSSDPGFVEEGAIPWLLVAVAGAERGPAGGALLARASFIHRVNTSGGVAPSSGCTQTTDIGAFAMVPYRADYVFYRPARAKRDQADPPSR